MKYACDFETTTKMEDCRVWAWGASEIAEGYAFEFGNSIESFLEFFETKRNSICYFHNLKFDGEFIFAHLFRNGWTHSTEKKLREKEFTTLISDMGTFFQIKLCFGREGKHVRQLTIYNSLNLVNFSVERIAKDYQLPIQKGSIDYDAEREPGHIITSEEREYLKSDCEIIARVLLIFEKQGLQKMTMASNALDFYQKQYFPQKGDFRNTFPMLSTAIDTFIRKSYKGGYVYVPPGVAKKDIGAGVVLDVNSLYPFVMYSKPMPYGEPEFYEGKYERDSDYPLFVQRFRCTFSLKKNYLPCIQIKGNMSFMASEYLESSTEESVELTLTSVDLALFREHYNVYDLEYIDGYKFKAASNLFRGYVNYWMDAKLTAEMDENAAGRAIAKLLMNSLYGKFGTNEKAGRKIPYLSENGIVKYRTVKEEKDTVYVPVAAFVTSWARNHTIRAAQENYERFLYADTDSLHLRGPEIPQNLDVDPRRLGAWKNEGCFTRARYLGQKRYIEEIDGKLKVTCASMPYRVHKNVTWENFQIGKIFALKIPKGYEDQEKNIVQGIGKMYPIHVPGGIILEEKPFTLREAKRFASHE